MSKTSAFIFFGIILVGLIGSIVYFTAKGPGKEGPNGTIKPLVSTTEIGEAPVDDPAVTGTPKGSPKSTAPAKGGTAKANVGQPASSDTKTFTSPQAAMSALAKTAAAKDFPALLDFVGEKAVAEAIRPEVKKLIEHPDFLLDEKKPFSEVSKSANAVRWALNYVPETGGAARELYADLDTTVKNSVSFQKISFPLDITLLTGKDSPTTSPAKPAGANPDSPDSKDPPAFDGVDALTVAHAFSKAVISRDFKAARALSDPATVTDERVAALMIAIEEGNFQLKEERPLVVTLSRDDITWVLTRVEADNEAASEFALELGQVEKSWAVNGLTFSKVLSALAAQAGGTGVAYSPIVEDPMGGDSLVLYFEFDQADLTPRGNRQLAIIADILSQGAERTIRINGHADAKGTDEYNSTLSDRRADAIRKGLISMGVAPEQVITEAFGETKPRRPNFNADGTDNPTGRSQNRRAEVYLDF